ncbi:hypothetical protein [Paenibacillus sp. Soil787]|uniref:hypothetical protein n=1 Tax=Paenibacillus sp. Soil787 TaxID=1736411 RepID=UPI0007034CCC|nr:hypothetical protein [Paenibacillus sp. Soil787]KRF13626.1 hypothetical protein ASG93_14010 [Paenibacillus sp. Soil787]
MQNMWWLQISSEVVIIHNRTCPIIPLTYPDEKFNRQVQGGTWLQFDNEEEAIQFYEEGYANLFIREKCSLCQQ